MLDYSHIRRSFDPNCLPLDIEQFPNCPLKVCKEWLQLVYEKKLLDGNAMTLSTASKEGIVTSRIVLLKYLDQEGFKFFTNYHSQKAKDIEENPNVSLTFYWPTLNRQITVKGSARKLDPQESDQYFNSRPRLNQLLALASNQDEKIELTQVIEEKVKKLDQKHQDLEIKRPEHWGGFVISPTKVEFWQGAQGRINQRISYERLDTDWEKKVLSP